MRRELKYLWVILLIVGAGSLFVSCDQFGDIDPIETACSMCALLDESGVCDMTQSEQMTTAGCADGEKVFVKVDVDTRTVTLKCESP